MKRNFWSIAVISLFSLLLIAAYRDSGRSVVDQQEDPFETPRTVSQNPSTIPLSPEESMKTFRLPKGYHLELVASEPMISEPVALACPDF